MRMKGLICRCNSNGFSCMVRDVNGKFYSVAGKTPPIVGTWMHLACTFDPVTQNVTLYVNGKMDGTAKANLTAGLYFGDAGIFGIGSRPITTVTTSLTATVDDFIFYRKCLTAAEALTLSQKTASLTPFPGPSFRSNLILFDTTPDFWEFTPLWSNSNSDSSSIKVEISTNRGLTWCEVHNGENFGMDQICYLPAANIMYRVTIYKNLQLDYMAFVFRNDEPQRFWNLAPVGINRAGTNYYSTSWMFVDVQKTASPPSDGRALTSDFYPASVLNSTYKYSYQVAREDQPTVTVNAVGNGTLDLEYASGNKTIGYRSILKVPEDMPATLIYNPYSVQIQVSDEKNPVRNISLVMTGHEATAASEYPFHPLYVSTFMDFTVTRFMDTSATNGQQIANWKDRTLPSYFGQDHVVRYSVEIQSIVSAVSTPSAFCGDWKALVTTKSPHPFVTGQLVTISGTDAQVTSWSIDGTAQSNFTLNLAAMIEVVSATSFNFIFTDGHLGWMWSPISAGHITNFNFVPGTKGVASVAITPGVAYEYIVKIAESTNSHPWINIPHLATDDFVTQLATFMKSAVASKYKVYIEYSNEVWNYGFPAQYNYAVRMGLKSNMTQQQWLAKRCAQIWTIFDNVWGSESSRLVHIVSGFAAGTNHAEAQLIALQDSSINPNNKKGDVICIAPYYGGGVAQDLINQGRMASCTIDEILDMTRDSLYTDTAPMTASNYAVAKKYNVSLVAYEGGPSLVTPLDHSDDSYAYFYNKLSDANRHPRMRDISKQMYWLWVQNGGTLFNFFSDIGGYSKWGSWGLLEVVNQDTSISYKYQAAVELKNMMNAGGGNYGNASDYMAGINVNNPSNTKNGASSFTISFGLLFALLACNLFL
eukprot:Phypoly_transcript_01517.p1 GENE.Phypoly_transcript_01517~~Phypoly_transcript_01517.p1  ORF type:complete len:874 (+),score=121.95 Phypoly_transcript_01517:652-3273(+)